MQMTLMDSIKKMQQSLSGAAAFMPGLDADGFGIPDDADMFGDDDDVGFS